MVNLSDCVKEVLAIEGWKTWVGQRCFSKHMVSKQDGMVEAWPELGVDSSFEKGPNQASLSFEFYIDHIKASKGVWPVHHHFFRFQKLICIQPALY